MEIKGLIQTCSGFPAQWEFRTFEDRPVYVRYRDGDFSIQIGEPGQPVDEHLLDFDLLFSVSLETNCNDLLETDLLVFLEWLPNRMPYAHHGFNILFSNFVIKALRREFLLSDLNKLEEKRNG